jgi:6-phosphofructokinase 1
MSTSPLRPLTISTLGVAKFPSPLDKLGVGAGAFVPNSAYIRGEIEIPPEQADEVVLEKAGPRQQIFFNPAQTTAAIVTCGGLCPGLNNVIRSLYMELAFRYGVHRILGIRNGYLGLNRELGQPPLVLSVELVANIHNEGGTMLGTSRGNQDIGVMVDSLVAHKIDILFCVGGDGTQRGAHAIALEISRRGLEIAVVGIPKTIDNDLLYCDRTFGFMTAIEKAQEVLALAHTECVACPRGVGLVKLMGRDSGFIACGASVISQEVNFTLIPESPFDLEGQGAFLPALADRLRRRRHAVIAVAEGAGQHLFSASETYDPSGNKKHQDIGVLLKERILEYFNRTGEPVEVKYIDPSYIIRSVPANSADDWLCDQLARYAVHAAMAGKTDLLVCSLHGKLVHVPTPLAITHRRKVNLDGDLWSSVLASNGQPAHFLTAR